MAGTAGLHRSRAAAGDILTGRGIAYGFRGATVVAEIAEVEVNRQTGHVWAKRLVCAHDCGLVVNPQSLRHTIECAMLHSLSRALHEEVQFDTEKVTSVDWNSHPTLTHADTPASDRGRAGQWGSQSGPAGSASLRSRRSGMQTDDRGNRQRHPRCNRRSSSPGSVSRCTRTCRA